MSLDRPALALPLPNGDIIANDDYNHRVIVVDPKTDRIVCDGAERRVARAGSPGVSRFPTGSTWRRRIRF